MSEQDDQIERIRDKLERVRAEQIDTFGSGSHKYVLGPPLDEDAVRAFEVEQGVTLPEGFRAFVTKIGHGGPGPYGGAGPYYGLYSLEHWREFADWIRDAGSDGWLTRPSPLKPGPNALPEWDDELDDYAEDITSSYDGILTLGSRGCTYATGLIVSGEARGRVVYLDADHSDPYVCRDHDFLDWYERWLDELLGGVSSSWFGYGPAGTEAELLELVANTGDDELRVEALRNLEKLPELSEAAWAPLGQYLLSEHAEFRRVALWIFAKARAQDAELVAPFLDSADPRDRQTACRTLMSLAPDEFAERVWQLLVEDVDDGVRSEAFATLTKHEYLDNARLVRVAEDERLGGIRSRAAYAIDWQPEHADLAIRLLRDPLVNVRRYGLMGARRLKLREALPVAAEQFRAEEDPNVWQALVLMFVELDDRRIAPELLEFAANGVDSQRLAAVDALARLGDERVTPIVLELLELDRKPEEPGRYHTKTFPELVRRSLEQSPSPKLRALGKVV